MKPIVFISSVSEGYEQVRRVAREAVIASGGQPVGFEDFPALDKSSRNACLDAVRDCDIYLGVFGSRYGSIAPSGKSITEEEYDEAVRSGNRRLIFVEGVAELEPKQSVFIRRAGDYEVGRFWKKFSNPDDLKGQIISALREVFSMKDSQLPSETIKKRLIEELENWEKTRHSRAWLATATIPTDSCEFLSEAKFSDVAIPRKVFVLGQETDPAVFEIEQAKGKRLDEDHWELTQTESSDRRNGEKFSIIRIYQDGLIFVAMNVTGREPNNDHDVFIVDPQIVRSIAAVQLIFLAKVYDLFDPHHRWDRIALLSGICEMGYKTFSSPKQGQTSYTMRNSGSDEPIIAFNAPKLLDRAQLLQKEYVEDLIAALKRRVK